MVWLIEESTTNVDLSVRDGVLAVYGNSFLEHHVDIVLQLHMKIMQPRS